MSYNIDPIHDFGNLPFAADDSLADAGGRFVTIQADGQVAVTAAGAAADGVLRGPVSEGFSPVVVTPGAWAYVVPEDGEDFAYGDAVAVGPNGGAVATAAGNAVMGTVIELADFPGDKIRIKLADGSTTAA